MVKGFAGTGKTTLALGMLREFKGKRRGVYLSTRVSYQSLKQQYPWVGEVLRPKDVRVVRGRAAKNFSFKDVRLGDIKVLMQMALDALSEDERPILIFDSWDALAKEVDQTERIKAEKALIAAIDGRKANAIFISEEPERKSLDYLADGVVTLHYRIQDQIVLREMIVEKLRGKLVDKPVRLFTLRQGMFEELPEFQYSIAPNPKRFDPLPDKEEYYSTGSQRLDKFTGGGLRRGSVILAELAPDTNRVILSAVLGIMVLNFINKGSLALIAIRHDNDEASVTRHLQPYSDQESLKNLKITRSAGIEEISNNYAKMKAEKDKGVFVEFDASFLELRDNTKNLFELARSVRENKDLLFIVSNGMGPDFNTVRTLADAHVKIWQREHYVLAKEVMTPSMTLAHSFSIKDGRPSLELVEVV
ncbi:MAG: AAA family ATPase [Thaumarchaeota archaeon]|nr:AAA family ATPase [Nitrososphaerota archaeon]